MLKWLLLTILIAISPVSAVAASSYQVANNVRRRAARRQSFALQLSRTAPRTMVRFWAR